MNDAVVIDEKRIAATNITVVGNRVNCPLRSCRVNRGVFEIESAPCLIHDVGVICNVQPDGWVAARVSC